MREAARLKLLGFLLAWAVVLAACASFAQPTVTRGGALKKRAYQTYGAMTLYVDPAGSDSNACTASGTSACATLTGALGKLPRNINHAVTINIAAGTYVENPTIGPFTFGATGGTPGTLSIQGDWTQYTPPTGTTTGTVTSYTAGTNGTPPTWTDSGQSWTPSSLKGVFFRMTSGAFSGQVRAVITDNTATSVTMTANMTGLSGNYELVVPAATINGTVTISTIEGIGSAAGPLSLNYLNITGAAAGGTLQIADTRIRGPGASSGVFLRQLRVFNSMAGGLTCAIRNAAVTFSSSGAYLEQTAVTGAGVALSAQEGTVTFYGYARSLGGGRAISLRSSSLQASATGFFATAEAAASSLEVILAYGELGPSALFVGNLVVRGGAGTTGIRLGTSPSSSAFGHSAVLVQYNAVAAQNIRVETALVGLRVDKGSRVDLAGVAPVFSGVTDELSVDGTAYTYSFLSGLSPGVIIGPYGSAIYK